MDSCKQSFLAPYRCTLYTCIVIHEYLDTWLEQDVLHHATQGILATHGKQYIQNGESWPHMYTERSKNDAEKHLRLFLTGRLLEFIARDILVHVAKNDHGKQFLGAWKTMIWNPHEQNNLQVVRDTCCIHILRSLQRTTWDNSMLANRQWNTTCGQIIWKPCDLSLVEPRHNYFYHCQENRKAGSYNRMLAARRRFEWRSPSVTARFLCSHIHAHTTPKSIAWLKRHPWAWNCQDIALALHKPIAHQHSWKTLNAWLHLPLSNRDCFIEFPWCRGNITECKPSWNSDLKIMMTVNFEL